MKIYQLHEYGGEWEDSYDCIIGSYLRKERAEEEKIKAEAEDNKLVEHSNRCWACPFIEEDFIEEDACDLNALLSKYPDYCSEAKTKLKEDMFGIGCEGYYSKWDKSFFRIEEVEIEE